MSSSSPLRGSPMASGSSTRSASILVAGVSRQHSGNDAKYSDDESDSESAKENIKLVNNVEFGSKITAKDVRLQRKPPSSASSSSLPATLNAVSHPSKSAARRTSKVPRIAELLAARREVHGGDGGRVDAPASGIVTASRSSNAAASETVTASPSSNAAASESLTASPSSSASSSSLPATLNAVSHPSKSAARRTSKVPRIAELLAARREVHGGDGGRVNAPASGIVTTSPPSSALPKVEKPASSTVPDRTAKPSSPGFSANDNFFASSSAARNSHESAPKQGGAGDGSNDDGRESVEPSTKKSGEDSKLACDSKKEPQNGMHSPFLDSTSLTENKSGLQAPLNRETRAKPIQPSLASQKPTSKIESRNAKTNVIDPKSALLAQLAARSTSAPQTSLASTGQAEERKLMSERGMTEQSAAVDPMVKYQLMIQQAVPYEAVQSCMKEEGVDPSRVIPLLEKSKHGAECEQNEESGTTLEDMSESSSYFNMLQDGCPKPAVVQKTLKDGADPVVLDFSPDTNYEEVKHKIKITSSSETSTLQDDIKSVKSHKEVVTPKEVASPVPSPEADQPSTQSEILLKDHQEYSKYFKMLKMFPDHVVRQRIQLDGFDIRALELGGDAPYSKLVEKPVEIRLADDPLYSKFFKMLAMQIPKNVVHQKMVIQGADVRALELGPDAFVSRLTSAKVQARGDTASPPAKAKVRRKKLHWESISDDRLSGPNRQTIWEDEEHEGVEIEMDMAEIESVFFASSGNGEKKTTAGQGKPLKRMQSVTLIDGKRAMNAAISLARVKLSYVEIAHAISVFDAKALTVGQLGGVRECLPTAEEVALVLNYGGDRALLGEAEKFILEICKVKRYTMRTECLLFRMSFELRHQELSASLDNLINACEQVKESQLLKKLLNIVLKLGNTLNGSGDGNEIRGFTVDSLLRLGHTKGVNQKITVLHYLIRLVKKKYPIVLDFQSELKSVPLAARESFERVDGDFGKLQSGLTQLSKEVQELQKDDKDMLTRETVASLKETVEDIRRKMESLDQHMKLARDKVQSVLEYFGEDPAKSLSSFFTTLSSFCEMFELARKEVDAADEAKLRAERMKMRPNANMGRNTNVLTRGIRIERDRAMSDRGLISERTAPKISDDDIVE